LNDPEKGIICPKFYNRTKKFESQALKNLPLKDGPSPKNTKIKAPHKSP
jgi:hypothetical protein